MFLRSVKISGFKSFLHEQTIEMIPGFNILIGKNGSGKSSVIEAICLALAVIPRIKKSDLDGLLSNNLNSDRTCNVTLTFSKISEHGKHKSKEKEKEKEKEKQNRKKKQFINPFETPKRKPKQRSNGDIILSLTLGRKGLTYKLNDRKKTRKELSQFLRTLGLDPTLSIFVIRQGHVNAFLSSKPRELAGSIFQAAGTTEFYEYVKNSELEILRWNKEATLIREKIRLFEKEIEKDLEYLNLTEQAEAIDGLLRNLECDVKVYQLKEEWKQVLLIRKEIEQNTETLEIQQFDYKNWKQTNKNYQNELVVLKETLQKKSSVYNLEKQGEEENKLKKQLNENKQDLKREQIRLKKLEQRSTELKEKLNGFKGKRININNKLNDYQSALDEIKQKKNYLKIKLQKGNDRIISLKKNAEQLNEQLTNLRQRINEKNESKSQLHQRIKEIKKDQKDFKNQLEVENKNLVESQFNFKKKFQNVDLNQELKSIERQRTELIENSEELNLIIHRYEKRQMRNPFFNLINQNNRNRNGNRNQRNKTIDGVLGTFLDLITLKREAKEYLICLNIIFGPSLKVIITKNTKSAINFLSFAKKKKKFVRVWSLDRIYETKIKFNKNALNRAFNKFGSDQVILPSELLEYDPQLIPVVNKSMRLLITRSDEISKELLNFGLESVTINGNVHRKSSLSGGYFNQINNLLYDKFDYDENLRNFQQIDYEINDLSKKINYMNQEIETQTVEHNNINKKQMEVDTFYEKINELNEIFQDREENLKKIQDEIKNSSKLFDKLKLIHDQSLESIKREIEKQEQNNEIVITEREKNEITDQLNKLKADKTIYKKKIEKKENKLEILNENYTENELEFDSLESLDKIKKNISEFKSLQVQKQEEYNQITSQLNNSKREISNKRKEIEKHKEKIKNNQKKIDQIERDIEKKKKKIKKLNEKIEHKETPPKEILDKNLKMKIETKNEFKKSKIKLMELKNEKKKIKQLKYSKQPRDLLLISHRRDQLQKFNQRFSHIEESVKNLKEGIKASQEKVKEINQITFNKVRQKFQKLFHNLVPSKKATFRPMPFKKRRKKNNKDKNDEDDGDDDEEEEDEEEEDDDEEEENENEIDNGNLSKKKKRRLNKVAKILPFSPNNQKELDLEIKRKNNNKSDKNSSNNNNDQNHQEKIFEQMLFQENNENENENENSIANLENGIVFYIKNENSQWKRGFKELSGGQTTCLALSFIFALSSHKKQMLYLFDEIDAALDDIYSSRISNILKKHIKSQIISVSHHPSFQEQGERIIQVTKNRGFSEIIAMQDK
ncbi:structural maintenance of chromosomes protein [Anaeramoeba flamelloides]|uniref:Structural maintenance of chromosomes protein n=1 Tax=Anaeramoeba flamelloides TaxID=1746091 RepID=A0AAV7Z7T7_9EUKA|nr:structural maintenance of chromosomes protein [Anaeramoeba flamelloides]